MRDAHSECVVVIVDDKTGESTELLQDFPRVPVAGEVVEIDELDKRPDGTGCFRVKKVSWEPVLSVVPEGKLQYYRAFLFLELTP